MPLLRSKNHPEVEQFGDLENGDSIGSKKQRQRGRRRKKQKATAEQALASKYVYDWAFGSPKPSDGDGFGLPPAPAGRVVFDLHSHSKFSDGFLSPAAVVERAYRNGVKVLALTDHDTMAGVPEAIEAARKHRMKIIPGVEISAVYSSGGESGREEPLHILAYYGSGGPSMGEELEDLLANIRDGRHIRAQNMLVKLKELNMPLKWDDIVNIAGKGVAPGRVHIARAMVEAGYVENLKQAFSRYLHDGGPAYAKGNEPLAEYVVRLVCRTGGIATLAHPWALKNPASIIGSLKAAGLHAMEVYRSDGKLPGFSEMADKHDLLKLGGSDYHGRKADGKLDLGSVHLPVLDVFKFLKLACPIWCGSVKCILMKEPSNAKLKNTMDLQELEYSSGCRTTPLCKDGSDLCQSELLAKEERENAEVDLDVFMNRMGFHLPLKSR
ncbi:hypothetical protein HPP92_016208 [Vanilla planifolia]|uniref:Polymerase/histidinol phosphatase N-terminal domain-containing protein n=1 Tax=Vanilla planifolia TaxID=51239 RepID=A0A835QMP1_VANPL|nr:hypothetical protein HPP92_016208 [Vanilla planifolia]